VHEQTNSTMPVGILLPHGTAPARIAELSRVVEDYGFGELWVSEDYFFLSGIASAALEALLYGVRPLDPVTYAGVTCLVVATAGGALVLSGRRVYRADPVEVLRSD